VTGFFVVGLFERHVEQTGEEGHLGAVSDHSQALKQRGDIFGGLLARKLLPLTGPNRLLEAGRWTLPF
jgi:hypothetical protein